MKVKIPIKFQLNQNCNMNEKVNADLKTLKFIFNKNKRYVFPIVTILVSVILFFQFVIPQFNSFLAVQKEAKELKLKLQVLKENFDIITNINESTLDSQLEILNSALPLDKDFVGILNSIYFAAQKTGVNLGNFSFKVGDLSKSENGDNFPVVSLSLPITSSVAAINSFVEVISKMVPLSEISFVKVGNTSSTVSLSFYYKPLNASNYNWNVRIKPISQKGLMLIDQLSKFENIPSSIQ